MPSVHSRHAVLRIRRHRHRRRRRGPDVRHRGGQARPPRRSCSSATRSRDARSSSPAAGAATSPTSTPSPENFFSDNPDFCRPRSRATRRATSSRWSSATASPTTRRSSASCSATARARRSSTCCWPSAPTPASSCDCAAGVRGIADVRTGFVLDTARGALHGRVAGRRHRRAVDPEAGRHAASATTSRASSGTPSSSRARRWYR